MILSYSLDRFPDMIIRGSKIHTIREDKKKRWKVGMSIQHWMHNPRNVKKNPHQFLTGELKGKQKIVVYTYMQSYSPETFGLSVLVDGRQLSQSEIETLAINDGLSVAEFKAWFTPPNSPTYSGYILHFTDLKY